MSKLKLIVLCLFSFFNLFSQDSIPLGSIQASSEKVDIRVGEDYFAKAGWHLDPSKKPDVFSIGSKWNYEHLAVSFITDIDSITFDVQPGSTYDFMVVLNGETECPIQILTASNPVFMNWKVLAILGLIFITILFLFRRLSKPKYISYLLYCGLITPLLFWLTTFIGGQLQDNYEHLRSTISELGTLGTKGEVFTSISFITISIFALIFSIGFYKASNRLSISKTPAVLSFIKPLSLSWAAIFPLGNEFHALMGASPLLLIIGALVGAVKWKKHKGFIKIRNWSLISGLIMLLILLRFIGPFGYEFEGLVQRFFHLGWSLWFFMVSLILIKKMKMLED